MSSLLICPCLMETSVIKPSLYLVAVAFIEYFPLGTGFISYSPISLLVAFADVSTINIGALFIKELSTELVTTPFKVVEVFENCICFL